MLGKREKEDERLNLYSDDDEEDGNSAVASLFE
jgi:hypothetical protein